MSKYLNLLHRYRRATWLVVGVLAVVTTAAIGPGLGFTKESPPLWTERPPAVAPSTVTAPNWVALAKVLKPAVVNINTKRTENAPNIPNAPDVFGGNTPFDQFFAPFSGHPVSRTVRSLGSGFIINADGYVVTNNHVVDGATEIRVKLADGREFPAKVVGRDAKTDLALLKIDATGLPVVPLGDSSTLQVGEPVMAIGNPFGLEQTVTTGIVSATGRVIGEGPYDEFIQTDASINPGNSGGPLINTRGQAIGINAAILSQSGGSNGIGFAIPIRLAEPVIAQLASAGHVVRGWLGVTIQPVTQDLAKSLQLHDTRGALVASVVDGSPAAKAGLKSGDVIIAYNGTDVAHADGLPLAVAETPIGRNVPLTVLRSGKTLRLTATIAELAEEHAQPTVASSAHPSLGLAVESVTPAIAQERGLHDTSGVLVEGVKDSSPAGNAGLKAGDVIVEVNHHAVKTVDDLRRDVRTHRPGTPLLILVHRDGGSLYVAVVA